MSAIEILLNIFYDTSIPSLRKKVNIKTRATVFKNLKELEQLELVNINKNGRYYKIQLTDKGRVIQHQLLRLNEHIPLSKLF